MTGPEIEGAVTQADRDLVASLLDADDELVEQINAGLAFSAECICAARHRMLGAAQERAEIVDWLRENAPQYSHEQLADAIERGEYKRSE